MHCAHLSSLIVIAVARTSHKRTTARLRLFARALVFCAIAAQTCIVHAQSDDRVRDLERRLEDSIRLIEALGARVRELEGRLGVRDAQSARPSAPPARAATAAPVVASPSGSPGPLAPPGSTALPVDAPDASTAIAPASNPFTQGTPAPSALRGFADAGFGYAGRNRRRGFSVGSVDLYFTPQFGPRTRGLIELVFEADEHGELHHDLERLQLGHALTDSVTAWGGRFHTPVGYWNTAFHHGQQLQVALSRPRFIDFEDRGGILPTHLVGAWMEGAFRMGGARLAWDVFAGNNPGISGNVLSPNIAGTRESGLASGFNVAWQFAGPLDGLRVGTHGLALDVRDDAIPVNRSRVRMLGAWTALDTDRLEVIGEYYRFRNRAVDLPEGNADETWASWAAFLQAGIRLGPWTPYARAERAVLAQADPFFANQTSGRSYDRGALGLRFDLTPNVALKLEAGRTRRNDADGTFNELRFQYAVRF